MFQPSQFSSTKESPPPPFQRNRLIGGIVLIVSIVLLLLYVANADATVFVPFNATQTAASAGLPPGHPTLQPGSNQARPTPRATPRRNIRPPDRKL